MQNFALFQFLCMYSMQSFIRRFAASNHTERILESRLLADPRPNNMFLLYHLKWQEKVRSAKSHVTSSTSGAVSIPVPFL